MMNNENGRSMVEMLGVLAIIGVLSVAGIAGYSMAMKKYRANEIVNTASQLVVLAQARANGNGGTATMTDDLNLTNAGGATEITADCTGTKCKVAVTTTDTAALEAAQQMVGTVTSGVASGTFYDLS